MSNQACLDCDSPGDGNCAVCHGIGRVLAAGAPAALGSLGDEISCSTCGGSGDCQKCDGSGVIEVGGEG